MANYLKMAQVQAILQLKDRGWSNRRIERELGIHRETVSRYLRLREQQSGQVVPGRGRDRTAVESVADSAIDGEFGAPRGDSKPPNEFIRIWQRSIISAAVTILHSKVEPGRFQTNQQHIHPHKQSHIEKGAQWLIGKTALIGTYFKLGPAPNPAI